MKSVRFLDIFILIPIAIWTIIIISCATVADARTCSVWGESPIVPRQSLIKMLDWDAAKPGYWPWVASLEKRTNGTFQHACIATLVTRRWLVTVGDCVNATLVSDIHLKFGVVDRPGVMSMTSQSRQVKAIVLHPKNNIALVRLRYRVRVNDYVKPIPLSKERLRATRNTSDHCYVVDWRAPYSDTLQQFQTTLPEGKVCRGPLGRYSRNKKFCPVANEEKERRTSDSKCHGSQGSPIMCRTRDEQYVERKTGSCLNYSYLTANRDQRCLELPDECRTDPERCALKGTCHKLWRLVGVVPSGVHCGRKRGIFVSINRHWSWIMKVRSEYRKKNE